MLHDRGVGAERLARRILGLEVLGNTLVAHSRDKDDAIREMEDRVVQLV